MWRAGGKRTAIANVNPPMELKLLNVAVVDCPWGKDTPRIVAHGRSEGSKLDATYQQTTKPLVHRFLRSVVWCGVTFTLPGVDQIQAL